MELSLVVQPLAGATTDVVVDIDGNLPCRKLADALFAQFHEPTENACIYHAGQREIVDLDKPIKDGGFSSGDAIALGRVYGDRVDFASELEEFSKETRRYGQARVEIAVVSGPDSGRRTRIAEGDCVVGRSPLCGLRLKDPQVASQHLRVTIWGTQVKVVPLADGVEMDEEILASEREISDGQLLRIGDTVLAARVVHRDEHVAPAENGRISFNRPPREIAPAEAKSIPLEAPPARTDKPTFMFATAIAPLFMGAAMYLFFKSAYLLAFMLLSPIIAVWSYFENKKRGKTKAKNLAKAFREKVQLLKIELEEERKEERKLRRVNAPDVVTEMHFISARGHDLWQRRRQDTDFMQLRLGLGDLDSLIDVQMSDGGNERLRAWATEYLDAGRRQPMVPYTLNFQEKGAVGIAGVPEYVNGVGAALVAHAVALHSPRDMAIAAAISPQSAIRWDWLKWLPHTSPITSPMDGQHIVIGSQNARYLVEALLGLVEVRQSQRSDFGLHASDATDGPVVLVVLDEAAAPNRSLVDRLLSDGPAVGVFTIWLGSSWRTLPGACSTVLQLDENSHAAVSFPRTTEPRVTLLADCAPIRICRKIALALSPVDDATSALAGGAIPRIAPLLATLELENPDVFKVIGLWERPRGQVPIGMGADGPFTLDIRQEGPHALVAGITGAGKSELLQALVAGMAANQSPLRTTFLFVDYKGGTAFAECVDLPHCVGMVTDLDGILANRVLVSLNAEIRRREGMLRKFGAKDLVDFEQRFPVDAPPSLVIVIDEFAALAREVPEFVEGVVDLAQRGRSLGLHLILATQRPSGVVNENIRANTNIRVCLRVSNDSESTDVIGVPDAARISRSTPGRAFARTGHSELTPFQSAWGGNTVHASSVEGPIDARLASLRLGVPSQFHNVAGEIVQVQNQTDLAILVNLCRVAATKVGLSPMPKPWLDPLPNVIFRDDLPEGTVHPDDPARSVSIGLLDEPSEQAQRVAEIDLESEGSVVVFGMSGSGKTTFLRSFAAGLATQAGSNALRIYGIDFARRGIDVLKNLPQVSAVVPGEHAEAVARVFQTIENELSRRKDLLAESGTTSLSEYCKKASTTQGMSPVPRIVVLLDGYDGFTDMFEKIDYGAWLEKFQRFVAEGRPLGVHFVITADRRGSVPYATLGVIPCRVVLRQADPDDLTSLGVSQKVAKVANQVPGRAFFHGDNEVQLAIVGSSPTGEGQTKAIEELGHKLEFEKGIQRVPGLKRLPSLILASKIPIGKSPLKPTIGVAEIKGEFLVAAADLTSVNFSVNGPRKSGKTNALAVLSAGLRSQSTDLQVVLMSPRPSWLTELPGWFEVAVGPGACEDTATNIARWAEDSSRESDLQLVLFVDDAEELFSGRASDRLDEAIAIARQPLRVIAACDSTAAIRAFGGWFASVRRSKEGLLLVPDVKEDGDVLGVKLQGLPGEEFPPGRGYFVHNRDWVRVQLGWAGPGNSSKS